MDQQPVQRSQLKPGGFTTLEDIPDEPIQTKGETRVESILEEKKEPEKPKSILDNKKLAIIVGLIGFIVIGIVFYFLFHSIGVI